MNTSAPIEPGNLLVILSDEHNPKVLGCAGHAEVQTPNLDALAARGTRFTQANCASPICVPARAALATGRPIFETGYWDNVDAYDGKVPSWHHLLRDQGHEVVSIGKLHYRGWDGDDYGFSETLLPMHIHEGHGELKMLLRDPPGDLGDGSNMLRSAVAGESSYTRYDNDICDAAVQWLQQAAARPRGRPWVLMVSLVAPHFPLTVPQRFLDLYEGKPLALPKNYQFGMTADAHPFVRAYAKVSGYNMHFRDEADVRRALACYYGLVSSMDEKVGRLMQTLGASGLDANTRVLYLSDHGDNLGARSLWGKSTMYEESVGIPMILSGPGIARGQTVSTPVGHLDVFNTVLDAVGLPAHLSTASPISSSLLRPLAPERSVFAEYHTVGSKSAIFMLCDRHSKYVHYEGLPAQLFDREHDPEELIDLVATRGQDPNVVARAAQWDRQLRRLCDPTEVDRRAKHRQAELLAYFGGLQAALSSKGIGGYTPAPKH